MNTHDTVVEQAQYYLPKAATSILLMSTAWIEQLDGILKLVSVGLGIFIAILTIYRYMIDIKTKSIEKKIKQRQLDEMIKKDYLTKYDKD